MKKLCFLSAVLFCAAASVAGWKDKVSADVRRPAIGCVKAGELRLKATYASVSVVYGAEAEIPGFALEYRVDGGAWTAGDAPLWFACDRNYRGSLLEMPEDAAIDVRLLSGGKVVAAGACRTWKTDVPIAKTVEIDAAKVAAWPYRIDGVGTADGWIRYTVKGVVDQRKGRKSFYIAGATNVILEGAVMRGAAGIAVAAGSKGVRIRNCEISGWGEPGKVRFDIGGGLWLDDTFDLKRGTRGGHNHTGAIDIEPGVSDVTVERCVVREPASRANSWRYSHPYGPAAIRLNHPAGGVVLRWNALFTSERHRFDDAVKGIDNSSLTGGFNRDADVYGNFMFGCNDDNVEFDGGGQNVRAWGNRFEESAMGVSLQMISASPCYVFKNAFTGLGMEHDEGYAQIKLNSFDVWNYGSQARVFQNCFYPGCLVSSFKHVDTNRVVYAQNRETDEVSPFVPFQPVGWHLDAGRLDFTLAEGSLHPSATATVALSCPPSAPARRFRVVACDSDDWFAVTPKEGVLAPGKTLALTVRLDAARLKGRRKWAGAFVVRDEDGFFRPVTLHVRTDHVEPLARAIDPKARACYGIPEKPIALRQGNREPTSRLTVKVPEKGRYYLLAYVRGRGDFHYGFNGAKLQRGNVVVHPHWTWAPLGRKGKYNMPPLDLEPGDYTLQLRGSWGAGESCVELGGVVLTDDPQAFEPDDAYAPREPFAGLEPSPATMARRVIDQFLDTEPCGYFPKRANWARPMWTNHVHYSVVSLWANAIECARAMGDKALEKRLTDRFLPWFGEKKHLQCLADHVDFCVFGALPYEVYISTGDRRALELGASYADRQWRLPPKEAPIHSQNLPYGEQAALFARGYSPQTRYWIDDMYMIIFLQVQAYRATGRTKYLDRTAKEMVLYLDKLQKADGLFDHAPDVPFVWGRGAGWMAGGMPLLLKYLPESNPDRPRILAGYRKMMAALLKWQRPNGLWGQIVTDRESWDETSCSAMFAYGFAMGVKHGWLDRAAYEPAVEKAWRALCAKVDEFGNLADVCCGTAKKNDRAWYMERPRVLGLPHGQAPMLWLCGALL